MGRGILRAFYLLPALLGVAAAQALDHNGLRQNVEAFVQSQIPVLQNRYGRTSRIEFALVAMDPRLNLPDCSQPLALAIKEQANITSRLNIQVSCNTGMGWNVFIPVDVAIYLPVVSANGLLARNTTLAAGDIQMTETDITRINGQYLTRAQDAVGLSLKRQLNPGTAITSDLLSQPILIKRGDSVTITAESDGLSVKMPGVAMSDGRRGEQIRIKNNNSAKIVDARVVEAGQVTVSM
ncbi:MAG: flagellar basal body P-ring formation chaperone FlgA [Spongiibacteraceae bacterium]